MKIWIVNHYAVPPTASGGTRHYTLARELIARGHQVIIMASSVSYLEQKQAIASSEKVKQETVDQVPFLWIHTPTYVGNSVGRIRNMLTFATRLYFAGPLKQLEKPDIIIGSSPHPFAALSAERLARRFKVPFVLEVRDIWPQTIVEAGNVSPNHPFIKAMEKIEVFLYRQAQSIISLLPYAANHVSSKGVSGDKVKCIPNGIDISRVAEPTRPADDETFTVMYAGAHGKLNGLDTVLDAGLLLQENPQAQHIKIRLIGDGPEKNRLQQRVAQEEIRNVFLEDAVPKNQVHGILQQAQAFLMILQDTAVFQHGLSPNKLFDYMAAARPVIYSVKSTTNPIQEMQAGLTIPPENAGALAEAILQLARTPADERWQMGLRGRRYVEENHDFSRLAERLEQILLDVVNRGSQSDGAQ
ncbi:MAG TPA: glycosyltransferase family 4 protein [Abditibacteriaceae bacterium]|jgi:glycosyltransferase involved in cell wall biosynthesis